MMNINNFIYTCEFDKLYFLTTSLLSNDYDVHLKTRHARSVDFVLQIWKKSNLYLCIRILSFSY